LASAPGFPGVALIFSAAVALFLVKHFIHSAAVLMHFVMSKLLLGVAVIRTAEDFTFFVGGFRL